MNPVAHQANGPLSAGRNVKRDPIAIVGIGCRFPGAANDPEGFWKLLVDGVDAITEVPPDRWNLLSFYDAEPGKPGKSQARWGGFLRDIDQFDPHFFGISLREAVRMDPQQRLLLEVAWEALEDGGQVLERLAGSRTAVFVGISGWDYSVAQTSFRDRGLIDVHTNTGGSLSIASNRISYVFDFRGPSVSVDTACSSALVAVHLACQSIWVDGCPLALAGGVNLLLVPDWWVGFSRMGMLSRTGRCRAFDARGDGFVRSEGAGLVVLKPLKQALADGDRIYAVIRGSAVNQDGRTAGMTVPNQESQEVLVRQACEDAKVEPGRIHFIEAHGPGTPVGDPIEARALGKVLSADRPAHRPCLLGSVKTNIGHLEPASGIAGLIKTALALHHGCWPGNLHFDQPNPDIDLAGLNLRVPVACEPFPEDIGPVLAGINSFGFGGTNAHVILQQAPEIADCRLQIADLSKPQSAIGNRQSAILVLSARSPEALRSGAGKLAEFVADCPASLYDIAFNLAVRRTQHDHRLAVVAHSKDELAERLKAFQDGQSAPDVVVERATSGKRPRLAFICSGQGPQWWAMGRQLLSQEPVFRAALHQCDEIVRQLGPWSLIGELTRHEKDSRLDQTAISQPAICALQMALAALWRSWGVEPDAVIGHSVGEVSAAYLAGIFTLEDALRIIYHRGRCMDRASAHGRMLAAGLTREEAEQLIQPFHGHVALAAVNSPSAVTLSGEAGPLEEIARSLEEKQILCRFLQVQYAFHSTQMDPVHDDLLPALDGIQPQLSRLPFISTVTGTQAQGPELGSEYWWHNVRQTVRFAEGVAGLIELGCDVALELGAHPVLGTALSECYQHHGRKVKVVASLRREEEERATMLRALGRLHGLGYPVDWSGVFPEPARFVRLPTYAWQHERCWHESEESRWSRLTMPVHPLLGRPLPEPGPCWENRLDLRLLPYLADHRVLRSVIVPATAFLEMALATAGATLGEGGCQVEDIKLANPCFLSNDKPVRVQARFQAETAVLEIHSRLAEETSEWTLHCRAQLRSRTPDASPGRFEPESVQQRCRKTYSGADCLAYSHLLGLDYGPAFQGIERVWQGPGEALGQVQLPEVLTAAGDKYLFHPALLDACFQVGICTDENFNKQAGALYLPTAIESVRWQRQPSGRLWCHARSVERTPRWITIDLDIYDDSGQPLVQVRGLRSHRVAGKNPDEVLDDLLYEYQWELWGTFPTCPAGCKPVPQDTTRVAGHVDNVPHKEPAHWLIFADRDGLGEQLAGQLRAENQTCTLVFPAAGLAASGEDRYEIHPGQIEELDRLFQTMQPPAWGGIVHLWNLDAPSSDGLATPRLEIAQEAGLLHVLHLVQAWEKRADNQTTRLFVVTRGAQSVGEPPQPLAVAQSPVIGLGRVIVNEYPRLRCKLVDLDPADSQGDLTSLLAELRLEDDEDEIALRGGNRYVHRFVAVPGLAFRARRTPSERETQAEDESKNEPYRLMIPRPGTLDGLTFEALQRRPPGPAEVEIQVVAAGLNFSDVMKALGLYPGLRPGAVPLGAECSGRITAVADGVTEWHVGDEVLAVAPFAFSSHVTTRAELVAPKPSNISFEEAAAIPIVFLTALYSLEHQGRLGQGERVLIHSASGGLGLAAVQLARKAGAEIFASAGTPEKRAFLQEMGIEHVLDSRTLAFADEVLNRTGGRGVDVVLNSLAGEALVRSFEILADYGRFLEVGKRDIYQNARLGLRPFRKNLAFCAIDLDQLMRDRPALLGAMLRKLVQDFRAGVLAPLPQQVYPIADVVSAFRYMQQAKHVGKIVLSMQEPPPAIVPSQDEPLAFRGDANYLITGGLGGFGLAVARWMVEHGARHLVLAGRRGVTSEETQQALDELARMDAQVIVKKADITNEEDVASLLADMGASLPPLRGIMQSAMVLEDSLLLNLDDDLMRRVLAPKVQGTWNLHLQTKDRPLDFFVMFSSLSSVFGHAGQGNYAAANLFLDALAHHRRAMGLPALTVNWGYLADVGYLAQRPQLGERLERQGVMSFSVSQALALLERALQRQLVQVSVMRVDWSRWRGLGVTGRLSPRFAHLLKNKGAAKGENEGSLSPHEALQAAAPNDRRELVDTFVRAQVARILGDSAHRLDADKSLVQLGLDSLMAVELRNWIEEELRVTLPTVELMRSPTLSRLSDVVVGHWRGQKASEESDGPLVGHPAEKNGAGKCIEATPTRNGQGKPSPRDGDLAFAKERLPPGENGQEKPAKPVFPVSHGQRGLWLWHQVHPGSPVFNICMPSRLCFPLDVPAFQRVWKKLIERHPVVRSTFEEREGEVVQCIHDPDFVPFEVVDASSWSDDSLGQRLVEETHRPFDLELGPLVRARLFKLGAEDFVFIVVGHHMVGDFWSLVVVLEEMRVLYAAECAGTPAALPPVTTQYHDFVRWQSDLLGGPEGEQLGCWWQQQLAGAATVLELPTDKPRPFRQAYRGGEVPCSLSADLTRRSKALAAQEEVTLYALLLGAFEVLLSRYTGQKDFLVGSPFAGRSRPAFANVVGYFINLLPLRANLTANPSVRGLLRQAWRTVLDAMAHQDYPFSLLVDKLHLSRETARPPLVQVLFALERSHRPIQRGAWRHILSKHETTRTVNGLRLESIHVEQRTCQYELELVLEEGAQTIDGIFHYDTDLFEEASIRRLVGHFEVLLEAMVADPDRPLSQLPMLGEAEKRQVLFDWNRTQRDYDTNLCLHNLYEIQAQRTPRATALIYRDQKLTYAQLDGWANQLAHRLRGWGVKPEALVVLFLERSPEMMAAILGTLKAGAAYVPLDPDGPPEKLDIMLEEVQPPVVLTQKHLEERLPKLNCAVICLDAADDCSHHAAREGRHDGAASASGDQALAPPQTGVRPDNLAYIIFTSGTTGRPKGVMVEHRSICNAVLWQQENLPVGPDDCYIFCMPYYFDASITSIFAPLGTGARLVLPEAGAERDPARLIDLMIQEQVTIAETVPSMLRMWLDHPRFPACRQLRWLSVGGEALPRDLPDRLFELLPVDLYNLYGPTEATVEATWWKCRRGDTCRGDTWPTVPIGWPIGNVRAYVLDEERRPVPIGVSGELWIGGAAVARGYLNHPELTEERFFADPFVPGDRPRPRRLYRTGDRCCWRAEGFLEFLGRVDKQIKLRGYRIELEEIETLLGRCPGVFEAAVAVHGEGLANQRLVAYVVPRNEAEPPTTDRLRRQLKEKLPEYALPQAFVLLPALPHTSAGKLDRNALPMPLLERPALDQAYVAPKTPLEKFLAELWSKLLHVNPVGVQDNFFDLGGSSILGVRVVNRLQEKLGQYIYVVALFEAPTIAGLAHHLGEAFPIVIRQLFGSESLAAKVERFSSPLGTGNGAEKRSEKSLLVPMQARGSRSPLFMVHPPGGIVACYRPLARVLNADQPLYAIKSRGLQGERDLPRHVEDMAAEYVQAMRSVQPTGPYHLGGWSLGGVVALEMAQQLLAGGHEVGLLTFLDTTIPHNPGNRRYVGEEDPSLREYGLTLTLEELADLSPEEQLPYLWDHAVKIGAVEAGAPLALVERLLEELKRLFHAHMELGNAYVVRPYAGRITLFRPIEAPVLVAVPPDRGWGQLAEVEVQFVPGQHHSMVQEPHVRDLAEKLRNCLERAE